MTEKQQEPIDDAIDAVQEGGGKSTAGTYISSSSMTLIRIRRAGKQVNAGCRKVNSGRQKWRLRGRWTKISRGELSMGELTFDETSTGMPSLPGLQSRIKMIPFRYATPATVTDADRRIATAYEYDTLKRLPLTQDEQRYQQASVQSSISTLKISRQVWA